jgi:hypothetical protein
LTGFFLPLKKENGMSFLVPVVLCQKKKKKKRKVRKPRKKNFKKKEKKKEEEAKLFIFVPFVGPLIWSIVGIIVDPDPYFSPLLAQFLWSLWYCLKTYAHLRLIVGFILVYCWLFLGL